jgi:hypothetical protein
MFAIQRTYLVFDMFVEQRTYLVQLTEFVCRGYSERMVFKMRSLFLVCSLFLICSLFSEHMSYQVFAIWRTSHGLAPIKSYQNLPDW